MKAVRAGGSQQWAAGDRSRCGQRGADRCAFQRAARVVPARCGRVRFSGGHELGRRRALHARRSPAARSGNGPSPNPAPQPFGRAMRDHRQLGGMMRQRHRLPGLLARAMTVMLAALAEGGLALAGGMAEPPFSGTHVPNDPAPSRGTPTSQPARDRGRRRCAGSPGCLGPKRQPAAVRRPGAPDLPIPRTQAAATNRSAVG